MEAKKTTRRNVDTDDSEFSRFMNRILYNFESFRPEELLCRFPKKAAAKDGYETDVTQSGGEEETSDVDKVAEDAYETDVTQSDGEEEIPDVDEVEPVNEIFETDDVQSDNVEVELNVDEVVTADEVVQPGNEQEVPVGDKTTDSVYETDVTQSDSEEETLDKNNDKTLGFHDNDEEETKPSGLRFFCLLLTVTVTSFFCCHLIMMGAGIVKVYLDNPPNTEQIISHPGLVHGWPGYNKVHVESTCNSATTLVIQAIWNGRMKSSEIRTITLEAGMRTTFTPHENNPDKMNTVTLKFIDYPGNWCPLKITGLSPAEIRFKYRYMKSLTALIFDDLSEVWFYIRSGFQILLHEVACYFIPQTYNALYVFPVCHN